MTQALALVCYGRLYGTGASAYTLRSRQGAGPRSMIPMACQSRPRASTADFSRRRCLGAASPQAQVRTT